MSNNMRIPLRHLSTVLFGSSHLRHCQEGSIVGCRSPLPGSHRYRNQQHGSFHGCLSLCTSHSSSFSSSSSSSSSLQSVEVPPTRTTVLEEENSVSVVEDHRPFFRIYYNDVYEVPLPPKHRFPMKKYVQVRKQIQQWISDLSEDEKNRINCEFVISPLATVQELETTHDAEYISRFLKGDQTEQEQRNVGFPWSIQGVDRALSSVGGTLAATCAVCDELDRRQKQQQRQQQKQGRKNDNLEEMDVPSSIRMAPWAAHVAGGTHHAFKDYGEGFSVFSDIAVASNVVLQRYPHLIKKILILDLDVHQGNGNAVLFQGRTEVSTVSIHCEGNFFSKKEKSDLDIELPIGCKDNAYLMTLHHWLNRIERLSGENHYDLLFFQAGVDILEEDRLGRMDLSSEGVQRRNEMVFDFVRRLNLPMIICMGGGYPRNPNDWSPIIDAHSHVYFGAYQYLTRWSKV